MKRKTSALPTRIWVYGCQRVDEPTNALFDQQLSRAHAYYNKLIEIERARRDEFRRLRSENVAFDALERRYLALAEEVEKARAELRTKRQGARKRVQDPEAKARIDLLKEQRKEAAKALKEARATVAAELKVPDQERRRRIEARLVEIGKSGPRIREKVNVEVLDAMLSEPQWPAFWKASARCDAEASRQRKQARAESGVIPGTYLLVEAAVQAACRGADTPKFKGWRGEGRVGVQLRRVPIADILDGKNGLLQIDRLPKDSWSSTSKRRHAYAQVRLRIGAEGGAPVWARFSAVMHRPLPDDAVVTWAWIKVRRIGMRTKYELQLSLESATFGARPARSDAVVGIDIGWRVRPNGVRVAYCYDGMGKGFELVMPEQIRDHLWLSDRLQGYADDHFNASRVVLKRWLDEHRAPNWVLSEVEHMAQWRAHKRLAKLAGRWVSERLTEGRQQTLWKQWADWRLNASPKLDLFDTFEEIEKWQRSVEPFANAEDCIVWYLELWRRKNRHLYQWGTDVRRKALARRKDLYRVWASQLATRYQTLVLEKFDLRAFARNATAEEEDASADAFHRLRMDVAPAEFRGALTSALGDRVQTLPAAHTTLRCSKCRHVNTWQAVELHQTCAGCGTVWDQDDNAARNLLINWFEGDGRAREVG